MLPPVRWLFLIWMTCSALAAPLPPELRWLDTYNGIKAATGPKDPAGQNDYYVTGEPSEVYRVVVDKFKSLGWQARERPGYPKMQGKVRSLGYCDFSRNGQRFGMQVCVGKAGYRMLSVFWYNWQAAPDAP